MSVGVLYVSWNRAAFVEFSFEQLLANTDWNLCDHLCVWDDYSSDGSLDWLRWRIASLKAEGFPCEIDLRVGGYRSPVAIMNRYVKAYDTPLLLKCDSDCVVPPGYLNDLCAVMDASPELELLGMQSGFTGVRGPAPTQGGTGPHSWERASHIGGVGLMRREAFTSRPSMNADGRHGFTVFQEKHDVVCGWITPDLDVTCLDQVPFEPWASLSESYTNLGWQRAWPPYPSNHYSWAWWDEKWKEQAA